jgi:hypothetical protein
LVNNTSQLYNFLKETWQNVLLLTPREPYLIKFTKPWLYRDVLSNKNIRIPTPKKVADPPLRPPLCAFGMEKEDILKSCPRILKLGMRPFVTKTTGFLTTKTFGDTHFTLHYAIFRWTKGVILKSCPKVLKLWICLLRGLVDRGMSGPIKH